jgi:hypothetical protein
VEVGPDGKEIATMLEATKAAEYHVDGLIFTPAETPQSEAVIRATTSS